MMGSSTWVKLKKHKKTIDDKFNTACINVLDESMMEWFNDYATVFMCIGRKLNRFGNERYVICCAITSIFWILHTAEGKDISWTLGFKKMKSLGIR